MAIWVRVGHAADRLDLAVAEPGDPERERLLLRLLRDASRRSAARASTARSTSTVAGHQLGGGGRRGRAPRPNTLYGLGNSPRQVRPDGKYVNVRRLFVMIEEPIDRGMQWVVFEPNDQPLFTRRAAAPPPLKPEIVRLPGRPARKLALVGASPRSRHGARG